MTELSPYSHFPLFPSFWESSWASRSPWVECTSSEVAATHTVYTVFTALLDSSLNLPDTPSSTQTSQIPLSDMHPEPRPSVDSLFHQFKHFPSPSGHLGLHHPHAMDLFVHPRFPGSPSCSLVTHHPTPVLCICFPASRAQP